jgi:hypothetical protein
MPKIRDLKAVAHDLVDHAMSGLSFLHPHVWNYARQITVGEFTVDLLHDSAPNLGEVPEPLRLATEGLRIWFQPVLRSYGFSLEDLTSAKLTFGSFGSSPYVVAARASLVAPSGREYSYERGWPPLNERVRPTK